MTTENPPGQATVCIDGGGPAGAMLGLLLARPGLLLMQRAVQHQMIRATADSRRTAGVPVPLRLLSRVPPLLQLFSRFMPIGIRNEHLALPAGPALAAAPTVTAARPR